MSSLLDQAADKLDDDIEEFEFELLKDGFEFVRVF